MKKTHAQAIVVTIAALAAAGEGAAPIPFSDCALLVQTQLSMIALILAGTVALKEVYIGIMELVFKGDMSLNDLGTKKGKETMNTLFKE